MKRKFVKLERVIVKSGSRSIKGDGMNSTSVESWQRRNEFLRSVAFRRVSFGHASHLSPLVSEGASAAGYPTKKFISSLLERTLGNYRMNPLRRCLANAMQNRNLLALLLLNLLWLAQPVLSQTGENRADPQTVRENLRNILDNGEFQTAPPADTSLWVKAIQWIHEQWDKFWEWFRHLFRFTEGVAGASLGLQWVFIAVFIVGVGALAFYLIRSYLQNRPARQAKSRAAFDFDDTEEELSREPNDWLEEAERCRAAGDFRRAYRAVFAAILLLFDQAGIILFQKSRSNGEYLRLLRGAERKALHDMLFPLVLEFDLRWYGEKPTDTEDVAAIRAEYDRMRERVAQQREAENENENEAGAATDASPLTPERV